MNGLETFQEFHYISNSLFGGETLLNQSKLYFLLRQGAFSEIILKIKSA